MAQEPDVELEDAAVFDAPEIEMPAAEVEAEEDIEIVDGEEEEKPEEEKPEVEEASEDEPEEEAAEVEEEAPKVDPDAEFSKRTRERIQREREVTARERQARIAAELAAVDAHKQLADMMLTSIDRDIEKAKADLVNAKETGETKQEVDLLDKLNELRVKKRDIENVKAQTEVRETEIKNARPVSVSSEAQTWIGKNKWFTDARFKAESLYVRELDRKLDAEGKFDKNTPEYFRELDRRINEELPDLRKRTGSTVSTTTPAKKKGSAAAPVGRGGTVTNVASTVKKRFLLTPAEQQRMKDIRLDPANPEHVKHYARARLGLN